MSQYLNDLKEIKHMMEKSSRFLSLSGASGIAMGLVALVAAGFAYQRKLRAFSYIELTDSGLPRKILEANLKELIVLGILTLLVALLVGFYFTYRKARHRLDSLWNPVSKRLFVNLAIPLLAGGMVVIALLLNKTYWPISEAMLIFYGLALINASHYTYRDVYFLGLCELILGLTALFINGYSLLFWTLGFGVLHIVYGASMYFKYDRPNGQ